MSMFIVTPKARYHAVLRPVDFTLLVIPSPDDGIVWKMLGFLLIV